jgi:hypothetical protein
MQKGGLDDFKFLRIAACRCLRAEFTPCQPVSRNQAEQAGVLCGNRRNIMRNRIDFVPGISACFRVFPYNGKKMPRKQTKERKARAEDAGGDGRNA